MTGEGWKVDDSRLTGWIKHAEPGSSPESKELGGDGKTRKLGGDSGTGVVAEKKGGRGPLALEDASGGGGLHHYLLPNRALHAPYPVRPMARQRPL